MKKITLLLCLFAAAAFGQNPLTLQEYVDAGLQREVATIEKPDGYIASVQAKGANVTTFDDRDDYLANCSDGAMLTLEDFAGGPGALIGCGEILSSAGDTCYPAGELQEGFEITANTPGNVTVYLDPNDGFGTLDPAVGSNTFTDFTVINFTGDDAVTSTGFDLYSLTGGSSVDVRVIGEAGLIDTVTVDVTTTGPVFVGILAAETIVSVEIEDLTGANVELVAQFLYGTCAPPPLNDDPETAASLTVGLVFEDFPVIADNTEATATAIDDPSCGNFTEADLWYSIVVPESGSVSVESREDDGSITDTAISIYEGEIGALVEVVCNDDGGTGLFSLAELEGRTPGEVLYARVWEWNGGSLGTFQMSAYDTPPPTNDDPEGAITLMVGSVFTDFPVTASNVSATDTAIDDPSCGNYGGADVWFSVVVPSTGQLNVETDTAGGITDTGMSVYSGEIGALVEVSCNDDDGNGLFSLIAIDDPALAGMTLFVRVWEWGGGGFGPFQVAAYSDCAVDAVSIEITGSGNTEANICVGDDMPDPIDVTIVGDPIGTNNGWVITDNATGEILGLPMAPPFDLDGVEPGICAVYYIRYEDGLTGLDMGSNLDGLDGCFDLSNPILIERVNEGGACLMCEYTLEMNDSFGDGWNGAIMDVLVDGVVVLDDVTLEDDPNNNGAQGVVTFPVNSTADVTTVFVDGGGFPGEVSYRILDAEGNEVAIGDVENDIQPNTLTADCPSCFAPTDLMAANVTDTSADLSWTDNNDPTSPEFTVEWGPIGFELGTGTMETGITMASFMLTGLDAGTEYEFYVTANCAVDDPSNPTGPVPFVTMAPPGECSYTLQMNDSFGDGWNGATIDVLRNGILALNDVSLDDDPNNDGAIGSLTFEINPGDDITTVFGEPGGFPGEITYSILDANFIEVATGDVDNNIETGTITADCPTCFAPFDLAAGNFAPGSADISWAMSMNALGYNWEIQDVGVPQGDPGAIAVGNTLVDTFDTAFGPFVDGNFYTLYVQAGCTVDDFSIYNSIDFLYFLPPANDDCENAIEVFCGDIVSGSTVNANDSGQNPSGDVFYTYVTPETAQNVTLSLCDGTTDYDSLLRVFDDECNLVNEIAVNDDSCGLQSELTFTATVGSSYTIMVEGFGAGVGNFTMEVTCEEALSVDDNTLEGFNFFPNPAQDVINLDARAGIENVTMFNLLGQKVLEQRVDGLSTYQLNVSTMAKGTYLMQVTSNGKAGVYRVIKM
ncbi:T9SS type A sorting domain-containing protein [uncultured Dokdonia sp.]|uniref:T9SS type A sorting domain-containing protein n=1 Tax=uncultured Dokdonia sp. TaxID=575653 RepID=UPI00260DF89A|nr:T9SS type A sorting domain-containing protein [uncultured Dokdonia sp.]